MKPRIATPLLLGAALLCGSAYTSAADSLLGVYQLALKNDPTIRAAEASYRAGQEAVKLGRSGLLPQINATGGLVASRIDNDGGPVIDGQPPTDSSRDTDATSWGVSLDQRVFDMPAWFTFTRGRELSRQAEAQFSADQQDLIVRVADAYFSVLRALDNLSASRANETATLRQLDQSQQRFEVGLIAITDVHEAQAVYDLAVAQRLGDEGSLGVALERLSILTGTGHESLWLLDDDYPVTNPEPMEKEEWVQFALANNFTVKTRAHARDAAHENARARKAEHYPRVFARLGYDASSSDIEYEDDNIEIDYDTDQTVGSASLNLSVPLYAGGGISASRRQAWEEYNRAQENYAGAVRTTVQATRAFHLQTVVNVARTHARQQAITSNQSAYDATQAGYEVGTRNIVDVLNAQQKLYGAIRDYANSRYDYILNMLQLKQQAGTISPEDVETLNQWLSPPPAPTLSGTDSLNP